MQRLSLLIFILSVFFSSCNSDDFEVKEVGSNLLPTHTEVQLIDTFTVKASSFIMDSVATSNAATMLVGQYNDSFFGKVKSVGYSQLRLSNDFILEAKNKPVFDSIVFISYYNQYYYGDTTKIQTINFHRVSEKMKTQENDTLYNINSFKYDKTPMGSISFKAEPKKTISSKSSTSASFQKTPLDIRIKLNDKFGEHLIELAKQHSDTLQDNKKWEKLMPGFCLVPNSDDNAAIIGLQTVSQSDTLMKVRLYYHETSGSNPNTTQTYDFKLGVIKHIFNNIESDRTGTAIENLKTQKEDIPSNLTNQATYIEGGLGIKTKLEIPYLRNLFQLGITGSLLRAELLMFPKDKSYNKELFPLPKTFILSRCDRRNRVIEILRNPSNTKAPLLATLVEDKQYEEDYYYSFDITAYVNSVLANIYTDDVQSLIIDLLSPNDVSSVNRIVFGDNRKNSNLKFKIKATYVVQKSE